MSMQLSVAARNGGLDAYETATGTAPLFKLFTGAPPANCAASEAGTLLASFALPSDWMAAAASGSKAMLGTWAGTGSGAGTAGHFRIYDSTGTTCHWQGTVSYTASAWATSTAYTLGTKIAANGNVYNCTTAGTSASTGTGPSGTGGSISDGTAVWAYESAIGDMGLDNTSIAVGQAVSVTSFNVTAANA